MAPNCRTKKPSRVEALVSTGDIARQLGVARDRVTYILNARRIEPIGRCGHTRAYRPSVIAKVKVELEKIAAQHIAEGRILPRDDVQVAKVG